MSQKKLNLRYIREMFVWPLLAAITALIPVWIFDKVAKYAYHYAFDLNHNSLTVAENGKEIACWQALFPWYIDLWAQPVPAVVLSGAAVIIAVNIFAGLFPMHAWKKISIVDGIRNESF